MKNKKKIIVVVVALVMAIILLAFTFVTIQNKKHQEAIEANSKKVEKQINADFENFNKVLEDENVKYLDKAKLVENMEKSFEIYKKDVELGNQENVNNIYKSKIDLMKKNITNKWDEKFKSLLFEDINTVNDKKQINTAITNLDSFLKSIEETNEIVISKTDYENNYKNKIEELKVKYNDRVKAIEKAEAEAKKKAEEEAKKKAEAEAKKKAEEEAKKKAEAEAKKKAQKSNSSNSSSSSSNRKPSSSKNNSSNGGGSSSGNRRPSSSGKRYVVSTYTFTSEDGVKTTKITYSDGTIEFIDSDGSRHDITNNGDIW